MLCSLNTLCSSRRRCCPTPLCSPLPRSTCLDPTVVDAPPPCCDVGGGLWASMRLCGSKVQLPLLTVSPHCLGALSWCRVRPMVLLLSRRVALGVDTVDVRQCVGRGCVSLFLHRAVMPLEVVGRGCGCIGPSCSCRVWRRVRAMVLLLSRRLILVTAAVNVCLSVGR